MSSFKPGELVLCNYEGVGDGVIYRVIEETGPASIKVKPVFACFPDMSVKKRKTRDIGTGWCTKFSVDDLRNTKYELEALLAGEMNRDPNLNPMAEQARNMSKIRQTVDDGETVVCFGVAGCNCKECDPGKGEKP